MPDPLSLITAPARYGLRLAIFPLQVLRRLTGAAEPSFGGSRQQAAAAHPPRATATKGQKP